MTKAPTHRILVVESDTDRRERMQKILSTQGYATDTARNCSEAVESLESAKASPYTVIIAGYPMQGDDILQKVRDISPATMRILTVDIIAQETLINAVNFTGIHSCLPLPLNDRDLIQQVALCSAQYDMARKQEHYRRLTQSQNRQLFQMALHYKKKEALFRSQLEQKQKEIRILESRMRLAEGPIHENKPMRLKDVLAGRDIFLTPEGLGLAFLKLRDEIKAILESMAAPDSVTLDPVPYSALADGDVRAPADKDLIEEVLPLLYAMLAKTGNTDLAGPISDDTLEDIFDIRFSENDTLALLTVKRMDVHPITCFHVHRFLEKKGVVNGIVPDTDIETWLFKTSPGADPFPAARSKDAVAPKNADIRYFFPTDFLHAGKINPDGSIDFQDRGTIPFVENGTLLAEKTFPIPGEPGVDVFGREITVDEPLDAVISAGPGTRLSEDRTRIHAATSGQPHLDAMGTVSVCQEFQIKGDLGFETGNVHFNGNVIVNGSIKEGFKVRCASLTAREIHGAEIDITGDLNVSLGIVDTEMVKVKGSVQAKFIHNSRIKAFGDLIVQKEIIDSRIFLSGACINENGVIINSIISAKMGIRAGTIGKPGTGPSTLTVGVDDHANLLIARVDETLNQNREAVQELEARIDLLEKEDQSLHAAVSRYAYIQDRSQLGLKAVRQKMEKRKASGRAVKGEDLPGKIRDLKAMADEAEKEINKGFDRQDAISLDIALKKSRIREIETQNTELSEEKKRILVFSLKTKPLAELKVSRKIEPGTRVIAPHSAMTLHNPATRCSIRESSRQTQVAGGPPAYDIQITGF